MEINKEEKNPKKVAIWIENNWAFGRIHQCIQRVLEDNGMYVRFFDWNKPSETIDFVKTWENYDVIIGNTYLSYAFTGLKYFSEYPLGFYERCVIILHCPRINDAQYTERLGLESIGKSTFCGVSEECVQVLKSAYSGIDHVYFTPFGADLYTFTQKEVKSDKESQAENGPDQNFRVGFIGHVNSPKNKNSQMFLEICHHDSVNNTTKTVEPIFIHGRPLSESATFYNDLDFLICCSDFEAGPLGIFEAAASNVAVLTRKGVGNASKVKGIRTFETVTEAVEILNHFMEDPVALKEYKDSICAEVRENWSMDGLISKHLLPIVGSLPQWLDFVEIGTSDFDTEIQTCSEQARGFSIEPVQYYLDRLPNKPNVGKKCWAVSDTDGTARMYSLPDEIRIKYNLPYWVRGCNRMNEPHPTVQKLLIDRNIDPLDAWNISEIPKVSFRSLVERLNLQRLSYLKLDTEGHDCVIMHSVAAELKRPGTTFQKPLRICFETNVLTEKKDQVAVIELFQHDFGYTIERRSGDETILRLQK